MASSRRDHLVDTAVRLFNRYGYHATGIDTILKEAGVAKVDAGPKGAVVCFRNDDFANPAGLVEFFAQQAGTAKLRPDHKLVYMRQWKTPEDRLNGVRYLIGELAKIASA